MVHASLNKEISFVHFWSLTLFRQHSSIAREIISGGAARHVRADRVNQSFCI
jgi:hypothetical protein